MPTGAAERSPTIYYTPGLEYDYKFNKQKTGDRFATDTSELHASFGWSRSPTKVLVEYFHIWSDASNDSMAHKRSDADGMKASLTQTLFHDAPIDTSKVGRDIYFSLPFSFKADDTTGTSPFGRQSSATDSYTFNPLFVFAVSCPLDQDDPERFRNLKFSLSPGYRLVLTNKEITSGNAPNVDGSKGFFGLLPRIDYDLTKLVSLNASVGWNHLTNFYSSDGAPRPDPNGLSFAGGMVVRPKVIERDKTPNGSEAEARALSFSLTYQYDGVNRDNYQHAVTFLTTFRFW